jgi:hypothetical protein
MRVFAHSLHGVELAWNNVVAWRLDGGRITLRYDTAVRVGPPLESLQLPTSIVGVTDDDWANHHRPEPTRAGPYTRGKDPR